VDQNQLTQEVKTKLASVTEHFKQEIGKIRTGRAHPGMLDNVMVEAYGQKMPLKAVGSITIPEPQQLQITPFDQMVKVLHQKLEDTMIAGRNARHEAIRKAEQAEKDKQIGKDERFSLEKQIDVLLADQKTELEDFAKTKEQDILTV
jgi:ribosome recycling factor